MLRASVGVANVGQDLSKHPATQCAERRVGDDVVRNQADCLAERDATASMPGVVVSANQIAEDSPAGWAEGTPRGVEVCGRVAAAVAPKRPSFLEMLFREFYRRHLLLPGGPQTLEELLDDVMAPSIQGESSGALFRESIESTHRQVVAWLSEHELELLPPQSGEFPDRRCPRAHVASLGSSPLTAELTPDLVDNINARQIRGAMSPVYTRPGRGLEDFVRQIVGADRQLASA